MASRMERYYKPETKTKRRTVANQELYRKIYDISEYSNIEGIATIDKANEIDITKIKNMLKNREEYQKQKDLRTLIHREEPKIQHIETTESFEDENRIYDISDMLQKAKEEKKGPEEKYRSLGDTNYNILKSLKVKNENEISRDEELEKTLTNTSLLKGLNDNDLSLDLLGDLKSNTTTIASNNAIQQLLEQAKEEELKRKEQNKKVEMDNSFFTSSLSFGKDDFEDVNKKAGKKKINGIVTRIFLGLSLLAITVLIIVIVYMLIK